MSQSNNSRVQEINTIRISHTNRLWCSAYNSVGPQNGCPKSGHNSDRSRTSNKGPDAGPAGAEIRYIPSHYHSIVIINSKISCNSTANYAASNIAKILRLLHVWHKTRSLVSSNKTSVCKAKFNTNCQSFNCPISSTFFISLFSPLSDHGFMRNSDRKCFIPYCLLFEKFHCH